MKNATGRIWRKIRSRLKKDLRVLALCDGEIHADLRHTIRGGAVKAKQRFLACCFCAGEIKSRADKF